MNMREKLATRLYNAACAAGFSPITPDSNIKPDGEKSGMPTCGESGS